ALSSHLRGVAYMGFSPNTQYQLLAAQELQRSLRKEANWEGLYALGSAFIRGGKYRDAEPVLRDLSKKINMPIKRYWYEMLEAEYYMASGRSNEALKILQRWQVREPDFVIPLTLMVRTYQGMNRADLAQAKEAE